MHEGITVSRDTIITSQSKESFVNSSLIISIIAILLFMPQRGYSNEAFLKLSGAGQKVAIRNAVSEISKALPVRLDETITWQSMIFVDSQSELGGIYLNYSADIPFENTEKNQIAIMKKKLQTVGVNGICSNNSYKDFIFVANVPVRVTFGLATGQILLTFFIDKSICKDAGYNYP